MSFVGVLRFAQDDGCLLYTSDGTGNGKGNSNSNGNCNGKSNSNGNCKGNGKRCWSGVGGRGLVG